jgi:hypothetical protein
MSVDTYSTATLVRVVQDLVTPTPGFLLRTFFPTIVEHTTEEIAVDVIVGRRRMAPFCSPLVQGTLVQPRGVQTNSFKPAYIKDKRPLDPNRPMKRAIGERLGGSLTPGEREMANLAFEMEDQIMMVDRRLEWMAASALNNGTIVVTGDGYPSTTVDFNRASGQTLTLNSPNRWGDSNISPADNVEDWAVTVLQNSGVTVTDLVFTPTAWRLFKADAKVKDSIDLLRGGPSAIEIGGASAVTGGQYKGNWGGYQLWLYNDWFVDPADNTEKPMLPDGTMILGSRGMEGVRAFGAIRDPEFNYGALAYAPKSWVEKDPAQRVLMMQSAPLVIPTRVNGAMRVKVR